MAKRAAIYIVAFAVPLIALLSHPELRRVLMWDALILTLKAPSKAMWLLPEPTDPLYRALKEADGLGGREQWFAYEKLYRQTGEVWIGVFGLRYAMSVVSPKRDKRHSEDAERLLKWASELSERDKDNAFPLLAKSWALFALGRDNEALSTFHEAALRPNYRTYDERWLQVRAPRTFAAEERLARALAVFFPHLSQLREMARRVVKHAADAEEKGDFERALRLYEDALKVGAKIREQGFWIVENLVGMAIQSIAFAGEKRKLTSAETRKFAYSLSESVERSKLLAQRFAEFARKHGRNDLAEWAVKEAEEGVTVRLIIAKYPFDELMLSDFTRREGFRLVTARLVGFALLVSVLTLAVVSLISAAFLWRTSAIVDKYSPITATLIVAGLPVAAVIWSTVGASGIEFWDLMQFQTYTAATHLPLTTLLLLFAVCFFFALWQIRGKVGWRTIAVLLGVPAFAGILTAVAINPPASMVTSVVLAVLLLLSIAAFASVTLWLKSKLEALEPKVRILSAAALAIALCALLFAGLWFAVTLENLRLTHRRIGEAWLGEEWLFLLPTLAVSAFIFFIAWGIWARLGHPNYRHIFQSALARLRGAAVLLLLICWWGYAVVGFTSLPLREKLHRAINDMIAHGELAVVERVVGSKLQPK